MSTTTLELGGSWRLGWQDARRGDRAFAELPLDELSDWLEATVPGEVHRDLERQGIIAPIEPGLGALQAMWVEKACWIYVRDLELDAVPESAQLVFERLELGATVFLNGEVVGSQVSAFVPLRLEVASALRVGTNRLRIELDAGQQFTAELPTIGYRRSVMQGPDKRHWLRTGQSQYAWDWSPRLLTIGITGAVRLELRDVPVRIADVVPVVEVADDHATATVTTRVFLANDASSAQSTSVRVGFYGQEQVVEVSAAPGESRVDVVTVVERPELWWPRGMGEQPLHPLAVSIEGAGFGERRELTIGLRTMVVDQSPAPDRGTLFRIMVNGVPFFAKGGNWVPISLTPNPVPVDLLDAQLARAVEANFTFLRVWGGGDYETEEFYDRCDALGIVVWQDLIFCCNRYPMRVDWYRDVVADEVRHQVRRLARHASLAIWAGDNENAWIGQAAEFPGPLVPYVDGIDVSEYHADHAWFEREAIDLVAEEDPSRLFWPSSPWSPSLEDHNSGTEGDQHPWKIGFRDVEFRKYRDEVARFPNEGGLLGPSSLPAILESLGGTVGEGERSYFSFAWKTHDNEIAFKYVPKSYEVQLLEWTGRDIHAISLEEYVYWTGLLHGEGLGEYVDNFRRRSTTTAAAVFWMYNDCWPTVRSWTIVDNRARRTPSFHPVRHAFEPVRVGIVDAPGGGATVWVHNDTQADVTHELESGTTTLAGVLSTTRTTVTVPARSVLEVASIPAPAGDPLASAYLAVLRDGTAPDAPVVSRNRLLAGRFIELPFAAADVRVRVEDGHAVFESDVFVLGVALDLDGGNDLADDFFDLYPGMPHRIPWASPTPPVILFTGNAVNDTHH